MSIKTTKIVRFHETGDAQVLKLEEIAIEEPGQYEVRIKVDAIGLNRAEILFRKGLYLEQPELPSRLGYEAVGTIEAIGDGVNEFNIGDQVSTIPAFSMCDYGVYGETAIVPAYAVAKYPDSLSPIQGASIWMQYITAYGALIDIANLQKEDTVIITAASSSVGIAAMQIAKSIGALIIATTRADDKIDFLFENGADHIVQTDNEDLADRVMQITNNEGANVIFDPIAGPLLEQLANAAAHAAIIIEYGMQDDAATIYPLSSSLNKGLTIRGFTLFEIVQNPDILEDAKTFIYEGLQSGSLMPKIDEQQFTLEQICEAHEYMESNQQKGKVIVTGFK